VGVIEWLKANIQVNVKVPTKSTKTHEKRAHQRHPVLYLGPFLCRRNQFFRAAVAVVTGVTSRAKISVHCSPSQYL